MSLDNIKFNTSALTLAIVVLTECQDNRYSLNKEHCEMGYLASLPNNPESKVLEEKCKIKKRVIFEAKIALTVL